MATLSVKVVPGASRDRVAGMLGDALKVQVSAPPEAGKANKAVLRVLAEFLNVKNGQTWQSIPVAVFYTKDLEPLHRYIEYPAIYHKDIVVNERIRAARPGEAPAETRERADREFMTLQQAPFFRIWASAAVDEILTALRERIIK